MATICEFVIFNTLEARKSIYGFVSGQEWGAFKSDVVRAAELH